MNAPFHSTPLILGERLFVFGGAYGNLQATQRMLEEAERLGFSEKEIIFTGDSIAYCGQPCETVRMIRESGIHCVMGNCEEALAQNSDNCGCGFDEGSQCSVLSDQWYRFCSASIKQDDREWMAALPRSITVHIGRHRLLCAHAVPGSINQFLFPSDHEALDQITLKEDEFDGYIVGHSGIPFVSCSNNKLWINSGAAGMPANDGTPRVWCAIVSSKTDTLTATTLPLDYDFHLAQLAMQEAGLANGYRDCLSTGIWPSHDVLPDQEKAKSGFAVQSETRKVKNSQVGLVNTTI